MAQAAGSTQTNWRAYLSTSAPGGNAGINARDRIGKGPWRNAKGVRIAKNINDLHSPANKISKTTALTELPPNARPTRFRNVCSRRYTYYSVSSWVPLTMKILRSLVLVGTVLLMASALCRAETPVLTLNDTNEPPFTMADGKGFLDVVAGEAFRRAGAQLRLVRLPAERGLINANAGTDDGELTRIAGLEAQYPNLIRVPEKLIEWEFSAFSKKASLSPTWEVLRARPVGHIRGWKIYEKQLVGAPYVVTSDNSAQLFRQLQLDRIEVALYERWQGLSLIKRMEITGVSPLEPLIAKREMYIYLNKRHAALVPKLAEALRAIKSEGLYDRLYREKVLSLATSAAK